MELKFAAEPPETFDEEIEPGNRNRTTADAVFVNERFELSPQTGVLVVTIDRQIEAGVQVSCERSVERVAL